jgi:hypothetical protein
MGLGWKEVGGSSDPGPSGEAGRGNTSGEPSVPRRFPPAAQPEIMRAAEKDEQYASFVYDACRDAFRHLFGPLSLSLAILGDSILLLLQVIVGTSFPGCAKFLLVILHFLAFHCLSQKIDCLFLWCRYEDCCSLSERG